MINSNNSSNKVKINKGFRVYIYTFFGVGIIVFLIGFIGINISLDYIQDKYIQLQIDVNKRQAERMSFFIENQIRNGISLDSISNQFQASLGGTEMDKGFLCMYDFKKDQMVCHPNKNVIGMRFNKDFVFKKENEEKENLITEIYKQNKGVGGIFKQGKERTDIVYALPIMGTNWFVNAHENIIVISSEIKSLRFRYILGSLLFGFLIAIASTITARKISRKYEKEIEHQNDEISLKNKQITDSINYAKRIQTAILAPQKIVQQYLKNSFTLYLPKDIVAGDFYWVEQSDDNILFAACDCTGHGVPGAMVSVVCYNALNRAVREFRLTKPSEILDKITEIVKENFSKSEDEIMDGMDISLCEFNPRTKTLQWAGANNPLWLIKNNELIEIKADKQAIGNDENKRPFTNHQLLLNAEDVIYIFSDGFADQFGGNNKKKFTKKRFKKILLSIQNLSMQEQGKKLDEFITEYRKELEQTDDILILGVKI